LFVYTQKKIQWVVYDSDLQNPVTFSTKKSAYAIIYQDKNRFLSENVESERKSNSY